MKKKIYEIIKQYDIIQSTEYDQLANIKLHKILGEKFIIYHGPYKSKFTKGYNVKCHISDFIINFNRRYKKVKILSKSQLAKEFLENKGFKRVNLLGVGLDILSLKNVESETTKLLNIQNSNSKYLLYIGRIEKRRNTIFLLKVFEEVLCKDKNFKLIIVGNGDNKYKKECYNYAKSRGLLDNIIYYDQLNQKELATLYKSSYMFLLPTSYEIFGMVLLESMYFGLPVLTTINGGSTTLITDNISGFTRDLNIKQWVDVILCTSSDDLKKIGNEASKTVKGKYLWSVLVEKYINILKMR